MFLRSKVKSVNFTMGKIDTVLAEADDYLNKGYVKKAQNLLDFLIHLPDREKTTEQIFHINRLFGSLQLMLGNLTDSTLYFEKNLKYAQQHFPKDEKKICRAYMALGSIYKALNATETSLDYTLTALNLEVEEFRIILINRISNIYFSSDDFVNALKYSTLGIEEATKQNDKLHLAAFFVNSCNYLLELGNVELAKEKFKASEEALKGIDNKQATFFLYNYHRINETKILSYYGKHEKALEIINNEIKLNKKFKDIKITFYALRVTKSLLLLQSNRQKEGFELIEKIYSEPALHKQRSVKTYLLKNVIDYCEKKNLQATSIKYMKRLLDETEESLKESRNVNLWKITNQHEEEMQKSDYQNRIEESEDTNLLEQLTHILSHDLKEPLRNIASFSNLLKRRYAKKVDNEAKEYLKFISSGADKINKNLIRLLEYTTLNDVDKNKIESIDIPEIISSIQEQYQLYYPEIKLSIEYPNTTILMTKKHAYTIFNELISNAVNFRSNKNKCHINIGIQKKEEGKKIELCVTDFGQGIDERHKDNVFKVFFKINKNTNGEGVGLSICKRIIHLYNGKINISSKLGKYSTVHITLPNEVI